jgi:glucose-6-phosphate dehydrogenase assembly protein OpcA
VTAPGRQPGISTIGSWEGDGVTVAQVDAALSDLRLHQQRAAVRTSVLTLVAVVDDDAAATAVLDTVYDLGGRHPSRTIVVVLGPDGDGDGGGAIDARASVNAVEREGRAVCFEDIVLRVRGRSRHHLGSVVEPFSLPDLPMVVWLPATLPAPGDPLLGVADRVVVDSRAVAGAASAGSYGRAGAANEAVLPRVQALARRLPVADLSWVRLALWRSLLAGLFEGPVYRPFLREVDHIEVAGNYGPRHLLAGWLLRRLALSPARVSLTPADHVSVTVSATHRHRSGVFRVARPGHERLIETSVAIDGGPSVSQAVRMRSRWPALALAGALTWMGRDDLYCEALAGALELRGVA